MVIVNKIIHQPRLLTEPLPIQVGTIPVGIMDDADDEGGNSTKASLKTKIATRTEPHLRHEA